MIFALLIQSASSLPSDASALESSISALEREITALDKSSGLVEILLPICTFLVVVGLVVEVVVIVREYREDVEDWERGTIHAPFRPSITKFRLNLIGSILITLGVLGEFAVGIAILEINGSLRTKNGELRNKSDQLVALINERAENAELEAEKLRKQLSWRHLTPPQRADLGRHLKQFRGQRFDLLIPNDIELPEVPEIEDFAGSLESALGVLQARVSTVGQVPMTMDNAGWVERARGGVGGPPPGGMPKDFNGIEVLISKAAKSSTRRAGEALVSWLKSHSLAATTKSCFRVTCHEFSEDPNADFENVLIIVVGPRP